MKKSIDVCIAIIDSDYKDKIGMALLNHPIEDFNVQARDRITQLTLEIFKTLAV